MKKEARADGRVAAPMEEEEKEAPMYVAGAVVDRASGRGTFP